MKHWKRFKEYWWAWVAAVAVLLTVSVTIIVSGQTSKGIMGIFLGTIILTGAVVLTFWPDRNEVNRKEERQ